MTQLDRVIAASRSFQGTCQADFLAVTTPDGGKRITRVAARINEARDLGYEFEILHDRGGTRVYRLVSEPDVESGSRPTPPVDGTPITPPPAAALSAEPLFRAGKPERPHWRQDAA